MKSSQDKYQKGQAHFDTFHHPLNTSGLASAKATGTATTPSAAVHSLTALLKHSALNKVNLSLTHTFKKKTGWVLWGEPCLRSPSRCGSSRWLIGAASSMWRRPTVHLVFIFGRRCKFAEAACGCLAADCLRSVSVCVLLKNTDIATFM